MNLIGYDEIYFKVNYIGEVCWDIFGCCVIYCDFNIIYYLFDYQMCLVEVMSFVFISKVVIFNSVLESIKNLKKNGEWVLYFLCGSK